VAPPASVRGALPRRDRPLSTDEDPTRFDIFEVWDGTPALDEHGRAPRYPTWRRGVRDLGVRRPRVAQYTVTRQEDFA